MDKRFTLRFSLAVFPALLLLCLVSPRLEAQLQLGGGKTTYVVGQHIVRFNNPTPPATVHTAAQAEGWQLLDYSDDHREFLIGGYNGSTNVCDVTGDARGRLKLGGDEIFPNYYTNGDELNFNLTSLKNLAIAQGPQDPLGACSGQSGNVETDVKTGSRQVKIAIIDSPVKASNHPSLFGQSVQYAFPTRKVLMYSQYHPVYNAYPVTEVPRTVNLSDQASMHGTAVAGIIAYYMWEAGRLNQLQLISIPVLNGDGEGTLFDLIHAIDLAKAANVDAANMSLGVRGGGCGLEFLAQKIQNAGFTIIASAGNEGTPLGGSNSRIPGSMNSDHIVTVGGTDCRGESLWHDSNRSSGTVDLLAPAEEVRVAHPDGSYRKANGTSFAAPIATGVLAKYLTRYTRVTARNELRASRISRLTAFGRGVLNTCYADQSNCGENDPGYTGTGGGSEPTPWKYGQWLDNNGSNQPEQSVAYPNPFDHELNLTVANAEAVSVASLLDFTGREVRRVAVNGISVRFDIGDLPAGQYFVLLRGDENQRPIPVTKQR